MEHATKCRNRSRVALSSIFHPLDWPKMQTWVSGSVCLKSSSPAQHRCTGPSQSPSAAVPQDLSCPAASRGAPSPPIRNAFGALRTLVRVGWISPAVCVCPETNTAVFCTLGLAEGLCIHHPRWMSQGRGSPEVTHHRELNAMLLSLEARDGRRIFQLTLFLTFDQKQLIFSSEKIL